MAEKIVVHVFGSRVLCFSKLMFFRRQCPFPLNGNEFFWRN